jgi:uncharacterized protein
MKTVVLYHANCPDGFCSAWLTRKRFRDAEFIPVRYGEPPPEVAGANVFILDFSYTRPVLLEMRKQTASLCVMDHHKTAAEDLTGLDFCIFNLAKSGARITQETLKLNPHWLVDYTEDRDLWRWQLPKSKAINAAIASYPMEFDVWDELARQDPMEIAKEGKAILRYKAQLIAEAIAGTVEIDFGGLKVSVANCTSRDLVSEVAGELAKGRPFGGCWYVYKGKTVWSLRSTEEGLDVSEVAKKYGGGGHRNAAGFRAEVPDMDLKL